VERIADSQTSERGVEESSQTATSVKAAITATDVAHDNIASIKRGESVPPNKTPVVPTGSRG
jgi:hypothetical protein